MPGTIVEYVSNPDIFGSYYGLPKIGDCFEVIGLDEGFFLKLKGWNDSLNPRMFRKVK